MSKALSRRDVLIASGAAAAALLLPNRVCAEFDFKFHNDDQFDDPDWDSWLRKVVGRASRMLHQDVMDNYLRLHGDGHFLGPGVWERSNNANEPREYWRQEHTLLEWQVKSLRINDFQPKLMVRWAREPDEEWWGKASVGTCAVIYDEDSDNVKFDGDFEIKLNTYWATVENDARNTLDVWGGVVAHEMLHNLGHRHGKDEYDDRWPMNMFERCVLYDGEYRGGYREYDWRCGGPLT